MALLENALISYEEKHCTMEDYFSWHIQSYPVALEHAADDSMLKQKKTILMASMCSGLKSAETAASFLTSAANEHGRELTFECVSLYTYCKSVVNTHTRIFSHF